MFGPDLSINPIDVRTLMANLELVLLDQGQALVNAWAGSLEGLPVQWRRQVSPVCNSLRNVIAGPDALSFDCIVSPANSFGLMDGGLDMALSRAFGGVEVTIPHVQEHLWRECLGHQNVGTCTIIDMRPLVGPCRYLAHCPTMRVPAAVSPGSDIVYSCMWSILNAVRKHNQLCSVQNGHTPINTLMCSGLATGVGRVPAHVCAQQMVLAYRHYMELVTMDHGQSKVWNWDAAEQCDKEVRMATSF